MIGRNQDTNNFRRANSHDNLFSLQEEDSDRLNRGLIVPSDHKQAAPFVPSRDRFISSNAALARGNREFSSTNRTSMDITSFWGPMETLMIGSNTQISTTLSESSQPNTIRSRANSEDMISRSHFSERFLLEEKDDVSRTQFTITRHPEPESRFLNHPKKSNSSATLFDLAVDPVETASPSNPPAAGSSYWTSGQQHQAAMPPAAVPLLKKSASMASLPFVERSFDLHSFPTNMNHLNNTSVNLSDARGGLDCPSFRSAPHSREPTTSSLDMSSTAPTCRYFLQGYCSRGARCFYSHNMNATIPFLQPQHLQQQLLSSSSSTNLSVPPSSPHIRNLSLPIAGLSGHSQALLPPLPLSVQHQHPTFEGQSTHQHHQQHQHLYQPSQQQHYHNHQPNRRNKHSSQYQQSFHPQSSLLQHASSNSKPLLGVSSINLSQNTGQHGSNTTMIPAAKKSATTVDEEANRYANVNIEDLAGQYYSMCKDQFGCRYLQKQIDEMPQKAISFLFQDIFDHVAELMTDPFGNYLCQKLLEFCDESQKEKIVARVAPSLVTICLNMHGTRAVQKLIENLTDAKHIRMITDSLATDAVKLIKDLNGNHVIQKCLSKLSPSMNQFVFDAVSATVVEVATHRHGCCVLQRCIDHAVETQKLQLVQEIAANGLALVQDPFGNYVVQYVLDLEDECYSSYIVRPFIGNVCLLSVQKFSSNVIEKCIRVSNSILRRHLIDELLDRAKLEALLRDSFANYVVQTALDYADAEQRQKLVECIKPILPAIRSTPYGKRIQTKLARSLAE